jgi:Putative metallopeptidase domain
MHLTSVLEALSSKKAALGGTAFSTSAISDPHIQRGIIALAQAVGKPAAFVQQVLEQRVAKNLASFTKAPMLYETISKNIVESELFKMMEEMPTVEIPNAPQFSVQTFYKLCRHIAAENDEFWPLRGFVDRRPLSPRFEFVPNDPAHPLARITTAAASPNGTFYFNNSFMQRLLNYATLKQIKPKGAKYEANGGPFPDGYAYIEFLIMHEFMHYSNDDFYYQKIIPKANPKIINWVGDFRSNYLLVKSGFEQLPIGLYNDNINYDRQAEYIEMYRLVEAEMKKMTPEDQEKSQKTLDGLSDNHEPGQEEGAETTQRIPQDAADKIDQNGKRIEKEVEESEERRETGQTPNRPKSDDGPPGGPSGQPGTGAGQGVEIDYSKIRPQFNWTALLRRFVTSQKPSAEETYSRPSRRGITGIEVARQTGAGAMKPGERQLERVDLKLALVLDTSGSMAGSLGKVFANVNALLRLPIYKHSNVMVIQFSSTHVVWKVSFTKNQAIQIAPTAGKVSTADGVFKNVVSGGTVVTTSLAADMAGLLAQGYNVLLVTDSDINVGDNMKQVMGLVKASARNFFILFDKQSDYAGWRKATGVGTANISHMS